jgi:hypothetical protein
MIIAYTKVVPNGISIPTKDHYHSLNLDFIEGFKSWNALGGVRILFLDLTDLSPSMGENSVYKELSCSILTISSPGILENPFRN